MRGERECSDKTCTFLKKQLNILRILVEQKKWHQWTENYLKFPWIFSLAPKDHLRPVHRPQSTEEFQNLTEIPIKKLCLMRPLGNMSKVPYDFRASQSVPYSPFLGEKNWVQKSQNKTPF